MFSASAFEYEPEANLHTVHEFRARLVTPSVEQFGELSGIFASVWVPFLGCTCGGIVDVCR